MLNSNFWTLLLCLLSVLFVSSSCKDDPIDEDEPIERLELSLASVAGDNVKITWNISSDSRFDSYELYRNNSSGIDKETGTFIHVETDPTKNNYTDHGLGANQTFYYRLYHVILDGSSIGSNVVSATTPSKELIDNGSFESLENGTPSKWNLTANEFGNPNNSIEIVEDATEGSNGLKIHHAEETGCYEQWITQSLDLDDLEKELKYVLTFDYKANFNLSGVNIILRNSAMDIWDFESLNYQPTQSWQKLTYELVLPSNIGSNDPNFQIHFCEQGVHDIWIDNVSLRQSD